MASQSAPLTESIHFPAIQNVQPGPSDRRSGTSPEPVSETAPQPDCGDSEPDEPSEVLLTYREFEEIKDCSLAICDSIRLFRERTQQLGDGIEAIAICSQHLDRVLAHVGNRLAGIDD